ncbi:serine hydrolase [Comamonas serinivorans]|uniref:Serine hydrolase n=1 Tax=Comamonas serinivorans TaxID=1082851 RepID=A0A1Y0EIU1_9BURK|nr:serine hydrolase domain-containing protein [Comamonas serinivorans]ARU03496.1 serine hydrolase [Comamonas serinivorans]
MSPTATAHRSATPPALPRARPEAVGLSSERLARLTARMQQGVDEGEIPGAVVWVARRGQVAYEQCFGLRDPQSGAPMTADALFRIASMSKPITSLAIMMLVEQGKLATSDPVEQYLPEFAQLTVGQLVTADDGTLTLNRVPLKRSMTVQDLLRHTSGLVYGFTGNHPIKQAYNQAKVGRHGDTNAEFVTKLAQLPLLHQPGAAWEYSVSTDVLGRIVEVVSGQGLDEFVAEHIAGPLRLVDTGFSAPASQASRSAYPQPEGPNLQLPPIPKPTDDLAFKSGGGGMVSTMADYARLCQFWLNGGELDGVRLLSRKTVALMTSNHLHPGIAMGPEMSFFGSHLPSAEMGQGFGLGFAVRTAPGLNPLPGSVGDFSWSGIYGTYFWVDPQEELFAVLMMQSTAMRVPYRIIMRNLVNQAIVD